jgi:hypothetical protein
VFLPGLEVFVVERRLDKPFDDKKTNNLGLITGIEIPAI